MRILSFIFLIAITLTTGQAQGSRGAVRAGRSLDRAASASESIVRKLQQQTRQSGWAIHGAAGAGRLRIKPSAYIAPLTKLDTDDIRRKNRDSAALYPSILTQTLSVKPIERLPTFEEMEDERMATKYDTLKMLVYLDLRLPFPYNHFKLADYAMRHNDEQFAIACIERVKTDWLTPEYLEYLARRYPSLNRFMPEVSRAVVISAYCKMVDAKLKGIDCDSARMANGDTLLIVTDRFNPVLNPLVRLSCYYEPSREIGLYKAAADSVAATYGQWSDAFKDTFARDFARTLMNKGEYATMLNYFSHEPLKQFPDSQADFALEMATCGMAIQNDSIFKNYLRQAFDLDSVAANAYWEGIYSELWAQFIADPSDTELADWLLETAAMPANNALVLSCELVEKYWTEPDSWKWHGLSDYTPGQVTARRAILHVLDKGSTIDEGLSEPDVAPYISLMRAKMLMVDPATETDAESILDNLLTTAQPDVRCISIIDKANIAGHGLDKPKEALKILKKNIKQLDDPAVTADVRDMWYDYMADLSSALGKTKDANKYLKLKESTK